MTRYSLEVPIGNEIRNVLGIAQVSEHSPDETNELNIKSEGEAVAGMYPLEVISKRGDKVLATRLVHYDEAKRIYPLAP